MLLSLLVWPHWASANSAGITGVSGKDGTFCSACHRGGTTPLVHFEGPQEVVAGAIATFRFVIESQASSQTHAGFNVAASEGGLGAVSGQEEQAVGGELTHSGPKRNGAGGIASFEFTWTAPDAIGMQTLFGAGNSVNRNFIDTGDAAAVATFAVNVVDAAPSCTGDCSVDGSVTVEDLVLAVSAAAAQADTCSAADENGDHVIDFGEIVAAVDVALAGCAP